MRSDTLFELIKKMTPTEKRYFLRYYKGRSQNENDYIRLFHVLNQMKAYNKETLLKKVDGFNFKAHIEEKKHHLLHLIAQTLSGYYFSNKTSTHSLSEIDVFIKKEMYSYANKRLVALLIQVRESEDFIFEAQILEKQILLCPYLEELKVDQLFNEQRTCFEKSKNLLDYNYLFYDLTTVVNKYGFVRHSAQLMQYERFKNHRLLTNPSEVLSLKASFFKYIFNYLYHASIGEFNKCYDAALKAHILFENHVQTTGNFASLYLQSMSARFSSMLLTHYNSAEFSKIKAELITNSKKISDPKLNKVSRAMIYQYELISYVKEEKYGSALELVKEAVLFIEDNPILAVSNAIKYLSFDIAKTYFIVGDYSNANLWFLKTNFAENKTKSTDIFAFSRILSLICDIFLDQTDLTKYNASYLRKQLRKLGVLHSYESFLINYISTKLINWHQLTKAKKIALLETFKKEITLQLDNEWKSNTILYFDFETWSDRKINELKNLKPIK